MSFVYTGIDCIQHTRFIAKTPNNNNNNNNPLVFTQILYLRFRLIEVLQNAVRPILYINKCTKY